MTNFTIGHIKKSFEKLVFFFLNFRKKNNVDFHSYALENSRFANNTIGFLFSIPDAIYFGRASVES